MSITTEIQRLHTNINNIRENTGSILEAIANKGVTVPIGSTLADCAGLIGDISGGGGAIPEIGYFSIGSNSYKFCRIDDMYIMSQNLRERIGTEGVDYAIAAGLDPELYGYYYYDATIHGTNGYCTQELQDIIDRCPQGWRFPNYEDLVYIKNRINVSSVDIDEWNPFGFDARKCGAYYNGNIVEPNNLFIQGNPNGHSTGERRSFMRISFSAGISVEDQPWYNNASTVRFVKDV